MLKQYGKSLIDVIPIVDRLIFENDKLMESKKWITHLYRQQPVREKCKVCENPLLENEIYFTSHEVDYKLCKNCGHLNGIYEDTDEFVSTVYVENEYGKGYYANSHLDYLQTVKAKYEPKAKFLVDSLNRINQDTSSLKYLDFGAGCGYMVYALNSLNLDAQGVDLSENEVKYGNKVLQSMSIGEGLRVITPQGMFDELKKTNANVVSFINVLEHIQDLKQTFAAIKENNSIRYVFFEVPLFSLSIILEIVNQKYYNRQLGHDHTHLFTKDSLSWIYSQHNFSPLATWDYGSEVLDLRRYITLELQKQGASEKLIKQTLGYFIAYGDELQLAIDRSEFASGTIVLVKIER